MLRAYVVRRVRRGLCLNIKDISMRSNTRRALNQIEWLARIRKRIKDKLKDFDPFKKRKKD